MFIQIASLDPKFKLQKENPKETDKEQILKRQD
jgi:hypothetical protein